MNEKLLVLTRNVEADLQAIERLYGDLGEPVLGESEEQERLIVIAYRLHGIYSAFENVFRNIAKAFENRLDPASWHQDLLQRMLLDLRPLRPAVIDEEAYEKLDELRRFRHLFRTGYGLKLDPLRLRLVVQKALELRALYPRQLSRFLEFLASVE
jgi:ribonuclease HepT-like protein